MCSLILYSCRDYEEKTVLSYVKGTVLNKRIDHETIGYDPLVTSDHYKVYIYDGIESKWYETSDSLYRTLNTRDSISAYLITITKIRKE